MTSRSAFSELGESRLAAHERPLAGGVQFVRAGVAWLDFH